MIVFYNTKQQTIDSVNELLTAHGYDPTEYDAEKIAENYMHKLGLYNSVFENPSMVWGYVDNHHQKKEHTMTSTTTTAPATINEAEIAARTLLAIKPREKITIRDIAHIWEHLDIKPHVITNQLQKLVPEWQHRYVEGD